MNHLNRREAEFEALMKPFADKAAVIFSGRNRKISAVSNFTWEETDLLVCNLWLEKRKSFSLKNITFLQIDITLTINSIGTVLDAEVDVDLDNTGPEMFYEEQFDSAVLDRFDQFLNDIATAVEASFHPKKKVYRKYKEREF